MINSNMFSKNTTFYITVIFFLLIIAYLILGQLLIWNIPYSPPFGGPDERLHRSMAEYIAKYMYWPHWDSLELARSNGISYSAGGSIVYWLHGLSYKFLNYHRVGAFVLLVFYLALAIIFYKKNKIAGFALLAGLLPQTLFVFSYVNSDTGTIISALLLGMSTGIFILGKEKIKFLLLICFFAGFAVTARQHLWAIALITFLWALIYKRKVIYQYDKKIWIFALMIALFPASWWFITSYTANDGDILGIFTNARSIARFGHADITSLARDWSNFSILDFIHGTLFSLYANWGYMVVSLSDYEYVIVAMLAICIIVLVYQKIDKKIFVFFTLLLIANFSFMILYSTLYDYQAQGRYLFPSFYIILGMLSVIFIYKKELSKLLLFLFIVMSVLNVYFSSKLILSGYVDILLEKPTFWEKNTKLFDTKVEFNIDQLQIVNEKLFIAGWIFNKEKKTVFKDVYLVLNNNKKYYRVKLKKVERSDVATAFNNNDLKFSGFSARMINIKELQKDIYSVLLLVKINNKSYLINVQRNLKVI